MILVDKGLLGCKKLLRITSKCKHKYIYKIQIHFYIGRSVKYTLILVGLLMETTEFAGLQQ